MAEGSVLAPPLDWASPRSVTPGLDVWFAKVMPAVAPLSSAGVHRASANDSPKPHLAGVGPTLARHALRKSLEVV